jgi:MoxR-like ATPase
VPAGPAALERARAAIRGVVRGKDELIEIVLVAVLAGGHVLLEDMPGVGKTTLARALAAALGGTFRRIQCTSDLLPGDITGVNILDGPRGELRFRPGPIFAHVVLADELNRATPRTQSALLEAMNERRVTVDGHSHSLPEPFVVLATQNPLDEQGTFDLPEAQLDRFLLRLSMGYPDRESEREILRSGGLRSASFATALEPEEVLRLCAQAEAVRYHPQVEDYLLSLVERSRQDHRLLRGVSTRGAEALYRTARALALIRGRSFVIPEDIMELAVPVLGHRVRSRQLGRGAAVVGEILGELCAPL